MDNVTHSLIGVAIARTAVRKASDRRYLFAALLAAVIASNLPDTDYIFTGIFFNGHLFKLQSLLFHRGLTHSLPLSLPLGLISAAMAAALCRQKISWQLVGLGWLGVVFHIFADAWNDYGVHPFSPFWGKWFQGDCMFIAEPFLWFALLPFAYSAALALKSKLCRVAFYALAILMLVVTWMGPYLDWRIALASTVWAGVSFWVFRQTKSKALPILPAFLVLIVFFSTSLLVKKIVRHEVVANNQVQIHQLMTSPAPANPFCWRTIVSSTGSSLRPGFYEVKMGTVSLWPKVFLPADCYFRMRRGVSELVPLEPIPLPQDSRISWTGQFRGRLDQLEALAQSDCQFRSFLGFARFPYWIMDQKDGQLSRYGDLRYSREKSLSFAEFVREKSPECPVEVPDWLGPNPKKRWN